MFIDLFCICFTFLVLSLFLFIYICNVYFFISNDLFDIFIVDVACLYYVMLDFIHNLYFIES